MMVTDFTFYVQIAVAIFTILDPLGIIPLFLSFTANNSESERKGIIRRTVVAVISILIVSALAGNYILAFFGIDIYLFQIAGGILLLLVAMNMLQAKGPLMKTTLKEQDEAIEKEDVSVVPLAMPLLAGPGTISIVIIFASSMQSVVDTILLLVIITMVSLSIWPIFLAAKWFGEKIGRTGINIMVRIMGLILASIAVKFILEGIKIYL